MVSLSMNKLARLIITIIAIIVIIFIPSKIGDFTENKVDRLKDKQSEEACKFSNDCFSGETFSDEEIEMIIQSDLDLTNTNTKIKNHKDKFSDKSENTFQNLKDLTINEVSGVEYLEKKSKEEKINPLFTFFVMAQESKGNPNAVSSTGCVGLFQFCYDTAYKEFSSIFGNDGKKCNNGNINSCQGDARFDPEKSIKAGTKYLSQLAKKYDYNIPLTLTAYNAGSKIADECENVEEKEERLKCILKETEDEYTDSPSKREEVKTYIATISNDINNVG